jgi:hypothetical protein
MNSDDPLFGIQTAGQAPWNVDRNDTQNRKAGAIWQMPEVKTPVLIFMGE